MDNKKSLVWVALLLVGILAGAGILYQHLSGQINNSQIAETDQAGQVEAPQYQAAPDFTIYDIDQNEICLSDFIGKPVILNFWASWCGPCKSEMDDFEQAYQIYGEDIVFLMINMTDGSRETVKTASEFIGEKGYTFPVYYDVTYSAVNAYGVRSLPTSYFVDANGDLIAYANGAIDLELIEKGIGMITKE